MWRSKRGWRGGWKDGGWRREWKDFVGVSELGFLFDFGRMIIILARASGEL